MTASLASLKACRSAIALEASVVPRLEAGRALEARRAGAIGGRAGASKAGREGAFRRVLATREPASGTTSTPLPLRGGTRLLEALDRRYEAPKVSRDLTGTSANGIPHLAKVARLVTAAMEP